MMSFSTSLVEVDVIVGAVGFKVVVVICTPFGYEL